MKRWMTAIVAVFAVGLVGACGRHRGHVDPETMNRMATERIEDALDDLDATAAQKTRILELKDQLFVEGKAAFEGHSQAREVFLTALQAPTPDAAQLHATVDARADAMRAFAHKAVDAAIQAHQTLTPEQRAKVAKRVNRHSCNH